MKLKCIQDHTVPLGNRPFKLLEGEKYEVIRYRSSGLYEIFLFKTNLQWATQIVSDKYFEEV